jgi:uncharacterized protein YejL (UPF0352 family)
MDKKGIETIQNDSKLILSIDWDDIARYGGRLGERIKVDRLLATMMRAVALALIVFSVLTYIGNGSIFKFTWVTMEKGLDLLPWIGFALLGYSIYLYRGRGSGMSSTEGLDSLRRELDKKGAFNGQVMINKYLDEDVLVILDDLFLLPEHEVIRELALKVLENGKTDVICFRLGIDKKKVIERARSSSSESIGVSTMIVGSFNPAFQLGKEGVGVEDVFLSLAGSFLSDALFQEGVSKEKLQSVEIWLRNASSKERYKRMWKRLSKLKPTSGMNRAYTSRYSPTLNSYGEDYTLGATKGAFNVSIGKDEAMLEILKILQREHGAAAIIIGEPGVGKTHFLKHLAVKMVVEDVPHSLKDHRLVNFNFNKAFTDNQSLEQFRWC